MPCKKVLSLVRTALVLATSTLKTRLCAYIWTICFQERTNLRMSLFSLVAVSRVQNIWVTVEKLREISLGWNSSMHMGIELIKSIQVRVGSFSRKNQHAMGLYQQPTIPTWAVRKMKVIGWYRWQSFTYLPPAVQCLVALSLWRTVQQQSFATFSLLKRIVFQTNSMRHLRKHTLIW